jgi:hypothetical protein
LEVHRQEETLEVIQEAVGIYRELTAVRQTEFCPNLVQSLHNLSNYLWEVHRREEALEVIKEAVGIY